MEMQTIERPRSIPIKPVRLARPAEFEPNFGPEDMHAIKAIVYIMNGIFVLALLMYSAIAAAAYFRS